MFGAFYAGAVVVPLDVNCSRDFAARVVAQTEPRIAFATKALAAVFADLKVPTVEFETLTLCPIDTRCIDKTLLRADEIAWLNDYHATVRERLQPLVSGPALAWLLARTEPLTA